MATTPNILLDLPVVSTTLGPEWATKLNEALEKIDNHDHSSSKGVKVTPAGLDINSNLDVQNKILFNFGSAQFQEKSLSLSGSSNANSLYSVSGNLFFTSGAGTAIQLTSGGSLAPAPGSVTTFETVLINSSPVTIGPSDTFVYLRVDTTTTRTINLPEASSVSDGRIYIIKDTSGQSETNPITISRQGSDLIDGASTQILNSNYGSWMIVGDGNASWNIS